MTDKLSAILTRAEVRAANIAWIRKNLWRYLRNSTVPIFYDTVRPYRISE